MNTKINRYCFVTLLNKSDDLSLPNEEAYKRLAKLVMSFLKGCNKNDDSDFLKTIITIASKIYYDVEETDEAVIRTFLTEGIRKNTIWDNGNIWGKAIFKDFRDIIRKFKIPEGQEKDYDKDTVLRNVLFNRLLFYVNNLSYFDMDSNQLLMICNKFASIYKFSESQINTLYKKVVIEEGDEEADAHFAVQTRAKRSSGSFSKNVNVWMNKLGEVGASTITKMKTYIKKKEIEEEPVPDFHEELTIDDHDFEQNNVESTDTSKNNSEASPPKGEPKGEIDLTDLESQQNDEKIEKHDLESPETAVEPEVPSTA